MQSQPAPVERCVEWSRSDLKLFSVGLPTGNCFHSSTNILQINISGEDFDRFYEAHYKRMRDRISQRGGYKYVNNAAFIEEVKTIKVGLYGTTY